MYDFSELLINDVTILFNNAELTVEEFKKIYSTTSVDTVVNTVTNTITLYESTNTRFVFTITDQSKYIVTCFNCIDCIDCKYCNDCVNCKDCIHCDTCVNSEQCKYCSNINTCVNQEYCTNNTNSKHCKFSYLITDSNSVVSSRRCVKCEDVYYSNKIKKSKHVRMSTHVRQSSEIYYSNCINKSYNVEFSNLITCSDIISESDKIYNSTDCVNSVNLYCCDHLTCCKSSKYCVACFFSQSIQTCVNCSHMNESLWCESCSYIYNSMYCTYSRFINDSTKLCNTNHCYHINATSETKAINDLEKKFKTVCISAYNQLENDFQGMHKILKIAYLCVFDNSQQRTSTFKNLTSTDYFDIISGIIRYILRLNITPENLKQISEWRGRYIIKICMDIYLNKISMKDIEKEYYFDHIQSKYNMLNMDQLNKFVNDLGPDFALNCSQ